VRKIVFVNSLGSSIGASFLAWSLHYLAGHTESFCIHTNRYEPLPDNPLEPDGTAHVFNKNHPHGTENLLTCIQALPDSCNFHTVYPAEFLESDLDDNFAICNQYGRTIRLQLPASDFTYRYSRRNAKLVAKLLNKQYVDDDTVRDEFFNQHFAVNKQFDNSAWGKREGMALNIRLAGQEPRVITYPHFYVDARDLWLNLESVIADIFVYIAETIDQSRYESWLDVYRIWSEQQKSLIRFQWYLPAVVDAIKTGAKIPLDHLQLTLFQEAIILHALMFKHKLNIKGYGLSKFPTNTLDLHKLLVPLEHEIPDYPMPF
jgi:hypothetical protein